MISIIVSVASKTDAIGGGNDLVVRISDDLKRFKELTTGHAIILGRKTHESIGRLLPNRKSFIVTRNKNLDVPGAIICSDIKDAVEKAREFESTTPSQNKEVFVIGGGEIYKQSLPFAHRIYLTLVESDAEGDVVFPEYRQFTREISREDRFDEKSGLKYSWITLEK